MRGLALFLLLAQLAFAADKPKVILAVFAHPDDETMVGPVLARYAHEGVDVYLAYATDGQRGVNDFTHIPAGDQLGEARRKEAACAAHALGAQEPIFFGVMDGDLGAMTKPLGKNIATVADGVQDLLNKLHPDAIVTWGPEGGYGHPDHRLVSDAVTQVVQASSTPYRLYYVELDADALKRNAKAFLKEFYGIAPQYLTVHVSYTPGDLLVAEKAFQCHATQYTLEQRKEYVGFLNLVDRGHVSFRPWFGSEKSDDLLKP